MKAKVKATGEIIDVSRTKNIITSRGIEKQYVDNKREWCTYVQSELEFIKASDIDWEQRRYEIARECVAVLMRDEITLEDAAKISVEQADALITELKKGGKL